jgi:hypothetical protein
VNSGTFPNVVLTQGALASLDIIPLGYMDVQTVATTRMAVNGYQIPWLHVNQMHVTTDYNLGLLSLGDLSSAAQAIAASSAPSSSTSKAPSSSSPSAQATTPSSTSAGNSTHN